MAEQIFPPAVPHDATSVVDAPSSSGGEDTQAQGSPGRQRRSRPTRYACVICGQGKARPATSRSSTSCVPACYDRIKADYPDLPAERAISVARTSTAFARAYVTDLLGQERGELTKLEQDVVQSLADHETLAENIEAEFVGHRTFGERLSDHLASFGGSWTFIIIFVVVLAAWMAFNVIVVTRRAVRSLSLHPAQSGAVVPRRHPGADHHDEPEAAGGEGPAAVGERLPGQSQGRTRKSATCTKRSTTSSRGNGNGWPKSSKSNSRSCRTRARASAEARADAGPDQQRRPRTAIKAAASQPRINSHSGNAIRRASAFAGNHHHGREHDRHRNDAVDHRGPEQHRDRVDIGGEQRRAAQAWRRRRWRKIRSRGLPAVRGCRAI